MDKETFDREIDERKKLASELNYIKTVVETIKNESHVLITKLAVLLDGSGNTPPLAVQIDRLVNSHSHLHERVKALESKEIERERDKKATMNQLAVKVLGGLITVFLVFMAGLWYSTVGH